MTNESLIQFVESITSATGPYTDLNGHRIVADAYKALHQHEAMQHNQIATDAASDNKRPCEISDAEEEIKERLSIFLHQRYDQEYDASNVPISEFDMDAEAILGIIRPFLRTTEPVSNNRNANLAEGGVDTTVGLGMPTPSARNAEQPVGSSIRNALKRLVDLKAHKDAHGKNNWYVKNQKDAWDQAKSALEAPERESRLHHLEVLLSAVSDATQYSWNDCDEDVIECMERLQRVFRAYKEIEGGK